MVRLEVTQDVEASASMGTEPTALAADGVGVRGRHGRWLFRDIGVDLRAKEVVRLDAAPGSGASTLLQVLAGVRNPSSGAVRLRPPSVGFVPQQFGENLPLSSAEYLSWVGRIRGIRPDVRENRIAELVRGFELGQNADQRLSAMPDGDARAGLARKLGIMQALLDPPSLLVLDDPWSRADSHLREILARRVLQLSAVGCLVIYSGTAPALRPSRYLILAGGQLGISDSDPRIVDESRMRLELGGKGTNLVGLPGVVEQHSHPDGVVLTVERAHCDELVGRALHGGWTLRRVEPTR